MKKKPTSKNIKYLEETRKVLEHNHIVLYIIIGIIAIVLFPFFKLGSGLLALLLGVLIGNAYITKDYNKFRNSYKDTIIADIFKKVFQNVTYEPKEKTNKKNIYNTKLFYNANNRYSLTSHDHISAKYKKTDFEYADVRWKTEEFPFAFLGQWYIFDFHKPFKSNIIIMDKHFFIRYKEIFLKNKFNQVELEDVVFNEKFVVLTKNNIDAFYILTPQVMENVIHLNKTLASELIIIFQKNKIHIGINSQSDRFEPSIHQKINLNEIENQTLKEIKNIINLIDNLNLDNSLFGKEV